MKETADTVETQVSGDQGDEKIYRYPGVHSFGVERVYQHLFFGRDEESQNLFQLICSNRLSVLYGKSGLGKTSLLQAGVFPRLRDVDLLPLRVRLNEKNRCPMEALQQGIAAEFEREYRLDHSMAMNSREVDTWWEYFKSTVFWRGDRLLEPVLILDQFEEVFKLLTRQDREAVTTELSYLVSGLVPPSVLDKLRRGESQYSERAPEVKVVLSLRTEHVGQLEELFPQIPKILSRRFILKPMERAQAKAAIVKPAEAEEPIFCTRPFRYHPQALDLLLNHLADTESGVIEPYQLQVQCHRVEQQVEKIQASRSGNLEVGKSILGSEEDLKRVVTDYYLDTIDRFGRAVGWRKKRRARNLCENGLLDAQGARLPQSGQQILSAYGLSEKDLDFLVQNRLLRREEKLKTHIYELSHDSLAQPILTKRRYRMPNSVKFGLLVAAVLVLAVGLGVIYQEQLQTEQARQDAETAQQATAVALQQAEQNLEAAQGQVNSFLRSAESTSTELTTLRQQLAGLQSERDDLQIELNEANGRLREELESNLDANQSAEALREEYREEIEGLNTQIANLQLRLEQVESPILTSSFAFAPEMVEIPGGSFLMGSPDSESGRDNDEGPQHQVSIQPFAMSKHEITFEQYDTYALAAEVDLPDDRGWGRGKQPVINVSWDDAQDYIAWLNEQTGGNYRLPTEAEWEYAARAETETAYWWGNDINQDGEVWANCDGCGSQWDGEQTAPVGSFAAPNAFGLYDMNGNVWEWVRDCYFKSYEGAPEDGSARESDVCMVRVLRGGSWSHAPDQVRSAKRNAIDPNTRYPWNGFRLAQDLSEQQ